MIYVDRRRVRAPKSLTSGKGAGARERKRTREFYASTRAKCPTYKAYKGDDVIVALSNLFNGKCAYCESRVETVQKIDVEHYRPKGRFGDCPGHTGYWWLAARWDNLLASCEDCNVRRGQVVVTSDMSFQEIERRRLEAETKLVGKGSCFPTANNSWVRRERQRWSAEQPLLIDPTRTDPADHIVWDVDAALVVAGARVSAAGPSRLGEVTIGLVGLNRSELAKWRTEHLNEVRKEIDTIRMWIDFLADPTLSANQRQRALQNRDDLIRRLQRHLLPTACYSAAARVVIDKFMQELAAEVEELLAAE